MERRALHALLWILTLILVLSALLVAGPRVRAARLAAAPPIFSVNSTGDAHAGGVLSNGICQTTPGNNVCTLRAAIEKANYWTGGGATINFAGVTPPATYTLAIGALVISNTVAIDGAGANNTVIAGNGSVTHEQVLTMLTHTVSISGVTIMNGRYDGLNAFGGGILHNDALTLTNSVVSHNSANATSGAAYGGGIYSSGRLTLINTSILSNSATTASGFASGGGIVGGFALTAINSTISGNTAHDSGGGLYGGGTLVGTTVSGNIAKNGGGIYGGGMTLINSTLSNNSANNNGGGIYHAGSDAYLFNVTIANNTANDDSTGSGFGGGIANASGAVNFQNSIIADNYYVYLLNGFPVLDFEDCSGTLTSQGYNIVSTTTDCTINGGYTLGEPLLGPLQNNRGPTLTRALLPGSPAIDTGQPGNCTDGVGAPLSTDQRGYRRPANGAGTTRCDIGAYELQNLLLLPLIRR